MFLFLELPYFTVGELHPHLPSAPGPEAAAVQEAIFCV